MITAHQAETIAVMTDGGFYHLECFSRNYDWRTELAEARNEAPREKTDGGWITRSDEELLIELGYTPLSRYSIHEQESYQWEGDYDYFKDDPSFYLDEAQRDELLEYLIDHSHGNQSVASVIESWAYDNLNDVLGAVTCDDCEERIE